MLKLTAFVVDDGIDSAERFFIIGDWLIHTQAVNIFHCGWYLACFGNLAIATINGINRQAVVVTQAGNRHVDQLLAQAQTVADIHVIDIAWRNGLHLASFQVVNHQALLFIGSQHQTALRFLAVNPDGRIIRRITEARHRSRLDFRLHRGHGWCWQFFLRRRPRQGYRIVFAIRIIVYPDCRVACCRVVPAGNTLWLFKRWQFQLWSSNDFFAIDVIRVQRLIFKRHGGQSARQGNYRFGTAHQTAKRHAQINNTSTGCRFRWSTVVPKANTFFRNIKWRRCIIHATGVTVRWNRQVAHMARQRCAAPIQHQPMFGYAAFIQQIHVQIVGSIALQTQIFYLKTRHRQLHHLADFCTGYIHWKQGGYMTRLHDSSEYQTGRCQLRARIQ